MTKKQFALIRAALDAFRLEIPSWVFADPGARLGEFFQEAAALTLNDRLADAGHVHRLTGCCPAVAVRAQGDFEPGADPRAVTRLAARHGLRIGSINPALFQDQNCQWDSFGHHDSAVRRRALRHCHEAIALGQALGSDCVSLWFADGANHPGQAGLRARKRFFEDNLRACHRRLSAGQTLLIEYQPCDPAFCATGIADWGMALLLAKKAGPRARVLVDAGHHCPGQNLGQIVAWLLDEDRLGGFHFTDRRCTDDDLTLGSIDPYQVFRIFHEIHAFAAERGRSPRLAYLIDQAHNEKPRIEATLQTVLMAQELHAKAALVDLAALRRAQARHDVVTAELTLKTAFFADVQPALADWRRRRGLPADPLAEHRRSGYEMRAANDRRQRRAEQQIPAPAPEPALVC